MSKIILIDDDYSTEILVENLGYHGYDARRISSYEAAIQSMDEVVGADLVVLDIIMERPTRSERINISGDRTAGMALLGAIREKNPVLPVLVFSATSDRDLIDALSSAEHTAFLSKWNTPTLKDFLKKIESTIGASSGAQRRRAFTYYALR